MLNAEGISRLTNQWKKLNECVVGRKNFRNLNKNLESIRKAADNPALTGGGFFKKNGLVYRRWLPKGRDEVEQLVLPLKYRPEVLKLAHKTPFAGHLGRDKTVNRISQRFYWPTMFADVRRVVKTCHECQKTAPRGRFKAPMIPLPIFSEPFRRIAMDIVGPLPKSRSGKQFILVTQFPEAIPMKSIDAVHVAACCLFIVRGLECLKRF